MAIDLITNYFQNLHYTECKYYRYIVPSYWLINIINIANDSTRKYEQSLISIQNKRFLTPDKQKINININPKDIGLVYHEIMMEIAKNFDIDYIIQVTFQEKTKQISIVDDIKIYKKSKFLKLDITRDMEIEIDEVYLLYPKDFTFKENLDNKIKENSNVNLNKSDEDEENEIEKSKKYNNNINNNNIEKMNLNNNNTTTDKDDKSKILQIKEEEDIINTEKNIKKKENNIPSSNKQIKKQNNLITNLSSFETISLYPKGLINPSVYCFMNTCLQCLSSIPELNYYFYNKKYEKEKKSKKKKLKACNSYYDFITSYAEDNEIIKPPPSIYSTCHSFLEGGRQHDCQEFLRRFLGRIQDELNYNKKYRFEDNISMEDAWNIYREVNPSFIDSVFTGLMTSTVKCLKCSHCSYTYDPFLDLSVSIERKKKDNLNDCLIRYFSSEKMDCGYKCEKCKKKTKVIIN